MRSLRQRLLSTLGILLFAVWLVAAIGTGLVTRHEIGLAVDAQLVHAATILMSGGPPSEQVPSLGLAAGDVSHRALPVVYRELSPSGEEVWRSPEGLEMPLADAGHGFTETTMGGQVWRLFTARTVTGGTLQVATRLSDHDAVTTGALQRTLVPLFLALVLMAAGLWFGVSLCLRPFALLSNEIAKRDVGHLEPLVVRRVPMEVKPLVAELNSMLGRLDEAFSRFDRFAADAAHELRGPVTAIRAQAEAGLAGVCDDERRHALEQVLSSADNCGLLVEQILLMARLETEDEVLLNGELELADLARDVMRDVAPKALGKGLDLSFDAEGPVYVYGNEELMRVLIRNLLDNAIRCTPAGGRVQLRLGRDARGLQLHVEDTGPGIPFRERSQVLQRFCRLPEAVGMGYGIGLSIVERIATVHRARVLLEDGAEGKGLRVCIHFSA